MAAKLGIITIGEAPRDDIVPDMLAILGRDIEVLQRGVLNGLSSPGIDALRPDGDDYTLVSRLRTGESVIMGKKKVVPRVQTLIDKLEAEGVDSIILLCTGEFPRFKSKRPVLEAEKVVLHAVRGILGHKRLGVMVPLPEQVHQMGEKWAGSPGGATISAGSPYGPAAPRHQAARVLKEAGAELIVLDCVGYTAAMKSEIQDLAGVPVICSNTMLARIAAELVN